QFVIANRPAITSAVTFRPAAAAAGAVLISSDLDVEASHVHVLGVKSIGTGDPAGGPDNSRVSLDICDNTCASPLTDVYVENFSGKSAFVRSSGVTIKGGEFGNYDPCADDPTQSPTAASHQNPEDIFRIWGTGEVKNAQGVVVVPAITPNNVVIDGVKVHDDDDHHTTQACPGATNGSLGEHVDCMQTMGGTNITIQNVVMWNCATSNIQAKPFSGGTMSDWTLQNNFFGTVLHPGNSLVLGQGACTNLIFRYNTIGGPQPNGSSCTGGTTVTSYGNLFLQDFSASPLGVTQTYSVFTTGTTATVSATNRKCLVSVVAPNRTGLAGPDYHLTAGDTCARAAGNPLDFPATDIDGQARPSAGGTAPDAGADEIS
ncbi:MAG: hypothetical protein QOH95_2884, partial [Gaiellaceae bacterium]|nr:hypothetical protein [Gaiellaceae bacterium]